MTAQGASRPVSDAVLAAAIGWQLQMGSGEATPQDAESLRRWLDAHADHRRAWAQLGEIDAQLEPARRDGVRMLLVRDTASRRWKQSASVLGLLAAVLLGIGAIDRYEPLRTLSADYRTKTGERRTVVLPDHTVLHLDTRSAVDLAFDASRRAIVLRSGAIAVETSHAEAAETRPFVVLTPDGSFRALGTRFVVRRLDDGAEGTRLSVTQSAVAARPGACPADPDRTCEGERIAKQGESLVLHIGGASAVEPARTEVDAWKDGILVVDNRPLSEVVAEIARYRPGHLSVDPRVAGLRVTGTLPLADTDQALLALTAAVPVDVVSTTRWWTRIEPRPAPR